MMFRSADNPLVAGQVIQLADLQVNVLSVNDKGEAVEVDYRFPARLESARFIWKRVDGAFGLRDYDPPRVGETVVFHGGSTPLR